YWTDVGTLDAYMEVHRDVLDRKVQVEMEGFEIRDGVWLGEGGQVDPNAQVQGPAYIGENTRIEGGVILRSHTVLGRGNIVRNGAFLHRCVVHDYVYVGPSTTLRGCVVGKNSDVKFGARVEEGVVVANECHIGEGAVLNPQVKVYPYKSVDPGAIVSESIIWQSGGARGLFGDRGITGLFNVDLTPETALRLATAYASMLPKRAAVVGCRDVTRAARVMKRAMVAGINGAGVDCHDVELVPSPVARFYARSARAVGGFSVRSAPLDPASVEIQFFDDRGVDVGPGTQRELERSYYREDFRRAFRHDIGELNFPARAREYYTQGLLEFVDRAAVAARRAKLVVDFSNGGAMLTGPLVLGRLSAEVLAVNAQLDEGRVVLAEEEIQASLEGLRRLVPSSGSELGAWIDSPGERLRLVDDRGTPLDMRTALLAYVWLVSRSVPNATVALPVATSRVAEEIMRSAGGSVVWTRISTAALTAAAAEEGVVFAGDEGGGYVFPGFLPAYDAVLSLVKLLELLQAAETTLGVVVDQLPVAHMARRDVPTPWEARGTVMRRMLEHVNGSELVTIDGVKAYQGDDWILVVPHPQEPLVRVWAEAGSQDDADRLATRYAELVEEMKG
ncbi:MAG TPA: mannose-1-phosphate guanyltransferase, partial [Actinomycetota bacterium]|nr:mannose-1-phosphate guanyltransferase [Actinomycetota bacterium]